MASEDKIIEEEKKLVIEKIFQDTISKLKALHKEKLELIKKFREENNLAELNKIRETLKSKL